MSSKAIPLDSTLPVLAQLCFRLLTGKAVTSKYIRDTYGLSTATAKRYLVLLEIALPVQVNLVGDNSHHRTKVLVIRPEQCSHGKLHGFGCAGCSEAINRAFSA